MDRKIDKDYFILKTREWFQKSAGYKSLDEAKAVIGISGGKDSSVVAALLAHAIGKDNVYGIIMPNGDQKDIQDSIDLVNLLGIHSMTVNIGNPSGSLMFEIANWEGPDFAGMYGFSRDPKVTTNLPARLRMCVLYAIANHINARVIGTGNKAEILCGYYTLWGDGACDFDPIANLYVDEVIELGRQLGLSDRFILKTPDDGMSGIPDEEKLGFSYADVKNVFERKVSNPIYFEDSKFKVNQTFYKIVQKIGDTYFKRNLTNIPSIEFPMD